LGLVYKTLQEVFTKFAYVSWENVIKITDPGVANLPKPIKVSAQNDAL